MIDDLAWHMFCRQANDYTADPAMVALAWLDDGIKTFWTNEAQAAFDFIIEHLQERAA